MQVVGHNLEGLGCRWRPGLVQYGGLRPVETLDIVPSVCHVQMVGEALASGCKVEGH